MTNDNQKVQPSSSQLHQSRAMDPPAGLSHFTVTQFVCEKVGRSKFNFEFDHLIERRANLFD
jgi:hypothetical protein